MKIFFVLLFVSVFEVFGQATKDHRVGRPTGNGNETEFHDAVVKGQSAQDRRTYPAGSLQATQKESSIQGTNCLDGRGSSFAPGTKGYKKCVDQANRVK